MTGASIGVERRIGCYEAHPLLDPLLPSRHPAIARLWIHTCRQALAHPEACARMIHAYAHPLGSRQAIVQGLDEYFVDADHYLDDLLRLVPDPVASRLRLSDTVRSSHDMRELFRLALTGDRPRTRYEAQRKLYVAKLLFDVDHCRSIRDGPLHNARFERILEATLWSQTDAEADKTEEVEVCCRLRREEGGAERFEIGVAPTAEARCWRFRPRLLAAVASSPPIRVYHYRSRFKREADPAPEQVADDGVLHLTESPRWPGLGRRSGSIVSKMIRRGIADPRAIQDVLGAMFIVGSRQETYALERRLAEALGGPLRFRDRVDTLGSPRDRARLDPRSSSGFEVLKMIVDVLAEDPAAASPYLFAVEIQIFPLEAYLRTLHDAHFASHTAYKRRQFLSDLLPLLFPPEVYGKEILALATEGG